MQNKRKAYSFYLILASFGVKKGPKNMALGYPIILYTSKNSANLHVNPVVTFCKINKITDFLPNFIHIWGPKRPKIWLSGPILYTPESTPDIPVNQVSWCRNKNSFVKVAKNWKKNNHNFGPILALKVRVKSQILITHVLGQYFCAYSRQISER